ncbi:MAG: thiamine-phosphate kinase [Actinobacteria bacterium]|nr:thiamine-phosphate kinase [Actinomycetota bacterium]
MLSEAEIIALIRDMVPDYMPGAEVPIGDDAAAFHFTGNLVLLTTDSIYEGVHFNVPPFHISDVGWKAMAAGVSDIAAMGGEPNCALLSLALHEPPGEKDIRSLISGVLEMLSSCNCSLIGGDVCRSNGGLALTVTIAGTPPPGGPVLRSGAGEGDVIGITGSIGESAAGLCILKRESEDMRARYPRIVEVHLRPRPRVKAGALLASCGASAMEDVSDGLAADLCHICDESVLGCEIEARLVPLADDLRALAGEVGEDPLDWALAGGEDYELLFTAPPGRFDEAVRCLADQGVPACRLGVMRPAAEGRILVKDSGEKVDLGGVGYDHFA